MSMIYLTAKSGFKIPALGLGTWKSQKGEVCTAVKAAIDIGYRHIDCALVYQNEDEVGEAITAKLSEGVVQREDLFVTGKLWNTYQRKDLVKEGCKKTLESLKLSYLDLFLLHWPFAFAEDGELFPKDENGQVLLSDADYVDAWKAMEELVHEGLVKAIGVSNFNSKQLERLFSSCRIPPVCLQAESSPYMTNQRLFDFARERGMACVAYSPLGSPDRPVINPEDPKLMDEPLLKEISARHGKTPAQVLIRFQLDRGTGVIPKSVRPERLRENFDVLNFSLTDEEVKQIAALDRNFRAIKFLMSSKHKNYPFYEDF